jgi:hypothetical protein
LSEISVESPIQRVWSPTEKQKQFIALPFSIFEALYGGSAGSGKSEILILLPLIYGFHQHPLFKGLILRRTFPELEAEIILRSKEWYSHAGGIYNESKKQWVFQSGAVIKFGHAAKEEDVRSYDSAQYNYIGWDECTSFTKFQYEYLSFSRCRSRTPDLPAIIRNATNPGNVGHAYFRARFVDPCKEGGKILLDSLTKKKRFFVQAKITDNPHIMAANPTYIQQLEMLPEAEKRAKLFGDWYTYKGQVFGEWRLEPLPGEPEIAQHVVDKFDIPSYWPRVIGIDWGFQAFTWIGWAAISPQGRVYIYREYAEKGKKTTEWINDLINSTNPEERNLIKRIRICHSASQQRGEMLTILGQLQRAALQNNIKVVPELADRARIQGKLLIHEYLRWTPKPDVKKYYTEEYSQELADKIFRTYGTKAHSEYVGLYAPLEPETNLPKLQVFSDCKEIISVIPDCVYDENKTEDVAEFAGDDPYDGLRILLGGIRDYMASDAKELEELKNVEVAITNISDQTSLYRRLELLESRRKQTNSVIRRRSSFRSRMRRLHG